MNGLSYSDTVKDDYYLRSFVMGMDLRPCCYICDFKYSHHQADITLGDFWGIEKIDPTIPDDGMSIIMIHSEKGKELVKGIKEHMYIFAVDFDRVQEGNTALLNSAYKPPLRDKFMKQSDNMNFEKLHNKFCGKTIISSVRRVIAKLMENT